MNGLSLLESIAPFQGTFDDCAFERPDGFRAPSLTRKAIPQCGATLTRTIFEMICVWQSNIKFVLGVLNL